MTFNIAVIPGDGIGPEVITQALRVLRRMGEKFGHTFACTEYAAGGNAIDSTGNPLPAETLAACQASDSVLLGAVGGPKWDHLPGAKRPEAALLGLRAGMGVYANLRPAFLWAPLAEACPLRTDIRLEGFDMLIVRELTGGIYFGKRGRLPDGTGAFDTETYTITEIERILKVGYKLAETRRRHLTVVDKANILETSRLWREATARVAAGHPTVKTEFMYVDNCAMQLIRRPSQFDVMVTSNMFGDILSDEASMLTGSIGMLASASVGDGKAGLYEPIHGSAPDIAGKGVANPIATILSVAMMMRYSLGLPKEADAIEEAVRKVLDQNLRTADIQSPGKKLVGTLEMADAIVQAL
ncbi:MAG: 3-isopropylmalate dehydrogenase [Kiritimatiellia bacterium]